MDCIGIMQILKDSLYPLNFIMSNTFFGRSTEFFFGMLLAYMLKQESKVSTLLKLKNPTLYGGLLMLVFTIAIAFLPEIILCMEWNVGKAD